MGILRAIFGPSKDEIWSQMAKDIGGEYIDAGFWGTDVLKYKHGDWEIILDAYTETTTTRTPSGDTHSRSRVTRMRAIFPNKDGFEFEVYRHGIFESVEQAVWRVFGTEWQDIQVGDPFFDKKFVIRGSNEDKIKWLLNDPELKQLIHQQPDIHLGLCRSKDGRYRLYFKCSGTMKKIERLKALFALFSATLERLVQLDSGYQNDPNLD